MFKMPALQYFPIEYKKRHKHTGNSECKVEDNNSKQLVNHCLLLGYSGSKYSGMQFQTTKDVVTVEGIVFKAMLENNWIRMASYKQPRSIKYQEASRTDKGVSAARQCCSILLRKITNNLSSAIIYLKKICSRWFECTRNKR